MTPDVKAVLRTELLGDEGKVLRVYDDATGKLIGPGSIVIGNPTVGIGRNLVSRGITDAESEYLLANDMDVLEADLTPRLPWLATLTPRRQTAVYSLYFNVALGNPRHFIAAWPNFLGQMQAGQFEAAAANLETSQPWASKVGPRAARLANFIRYG